MSNSKLKNLTFNNISNDVENILKSADDSYVQVYPEFINYFENLDTIEKHHLVIASHFIYGWMPTIITLKTEKEKQVLTILNKVKSRVEIDVNELNILKKCINNSLVGVSKLLHFINPKDYAIWDSRIFRYLTEQKSTSGIQKPEIFIEYLAGVKRISKNKNFKKLHIEIEKSFSYRISPMRAIEYVMFETDKQEQSMLKKQTKT